MDPIPINMSCPNISRLSWKMLQWLGERSVVRHHDCKEDNASDESRVLACLPTSLEMHAADIHFPSPVEPYVRSESSIYKELSSTLMPPESLKPVSSASPRVGLAAIPPLDWEFPVATLDQYHQIGAYQVHNMVDHNSHVTRPRPPGRVCCES